MKRIILIAAALCAAACGGPQAQKRWDGDPSLYGVRVEWSSEVAYHVRPDTNDRLRRVLQMTAQHYGYPPESLAGMRIVIVAFFVNGPDGGQHFGWYDQASNTATIAWDVSRCVEDLVIPHEALHYWIQDWNHTGQDWNTLPDLMAQIRAGTDCPTG